MNILLIKRLSLYRLIDETYNKEWIVYIKEPLNNPNSVIEYLGRYTHKIAISNARIVSYKDNKVSFRYKGYKKIIINLKNDIR